MGLLGKKMVVLASFVVFTSAMMDHEGECPVINAQNIGNYPAVATMFCKQYTSKEEAKRRNMDSMASISFDEGECFYWGFQATGNKEGFGKGMKHLTGEGTTLQEFVKMRQLELKGEREKKGNKCSYSRSDDYSHIPFKISPN